LPLGFALQLTAAVSVLIMFLVGSFRDYPLTASKAYGTILHNQGERAVSDGEEKTRPQVFREHRPEIVPNDAEEAARADRVVASFNANPVFDQDKKIIAIAIKWALGNGKTETILIDRYPSTILRMMFDHLEQNNWTALALVQPDATLQ
jgi:hypothetical protein